MGLHRNDIVASKEEGGVPEAKDDMSKCLWEQDLTHGIRCL